VPPDLNLPKKIIVSNLRFLKSPPSVTLYSFLGNSLLVKKKSLKKIETKQAFYLL